MDRALRGVSARTILGLPTTLAGMAELADAADSKSADPYQVVGVRPPLPAPAISHNHKYLRAIGGTRAVFIILTIPTACAQTVPKRGVLRFFELQHRVANI